jgi:hypothetical protein
MSSSEWIEWSGGKCPVPDSTITEVRFRSETFETITGRADYFGWEWPADDPYYDDITAYRVVSQ